MENTIDSKIKFLALYIGSEIEYPDLDDKTTVAILSGISIYDGIETTYKRKRNGCSGDLLSLKSNGNHNTNALNAKIRLKSLSAISDEDAIEVAKIITKGGDSEQLFSVSKGYTINGFNIPFENVICVEVKTFINHPSSPKYYLSDLIQIDSEDCEVIRGRFENDGLEHKDDHCDNSLEVYDFLRSKGYALPFMGLSVSEMTNYGWIKLTS